MEQRKKNIGLAGSLIFLSLCLLAFVYFSNTKSSIADAELFHVSDQAEIDQVEFQGPKSSTKLSYDGVGWKVNDQWQADRQMVKVFFAALLQSKPKRRLPDTMADTIKAKGVLVKLSRSGELIKEFWVYGKEDVNQTYFLNKSSADPYLVTIPGYRVYLASIFTMTAGEWRDKRIFNFNWQNFKSLTVSFPDEPAQNYSVSFTGKFFGIAGMPAIDTTKLNDFLDYVSLAQADRYLSADEAAHVMASNEKPLMEIEAKDIADRKYTLQLYKPSENGVTGKYNDELIYLNVRAFGQLTRKRAYFLPR